ncbi:MAG: hypothetical protein AB7O59_20620 [Pirellulales bacterium]
MSDTAHPLLKMLVHNRFFAAINAAGIALALVAAMVNVFVGPFNAAMWLVPLFMLGFALGTSFLVQGALLQAERPIAPNWMVGAVAGKRLGKLVAYFLHCFHRTNMRIVSPVFLYLVPSIFLVVAVVLLVAAIRGQINPGG